MKINNIKTTILDDPQDVGLYSAQLVQNLLKHKPKALLCFPAGSTVIPTCEALVKMQEAGTLDVSQAQFVALDEWLDLEDETQNCTNFLRKHLYTPLGLNESQLKLFDIHSEDLGRVCRDIDQFIDNHGGIDLVFLGLGMNGHLGLNEPGSDFNSKTRVVKIADTTKEVGQKYFSQPTELTRGITLGMEQFQKAGEVILQITGNHKQEIVKELYSRGKTEDLPGTIFHDLPQGMIVLDKVAARLIEDPESV